MLGYFGLTGVRAQSTTVERSSPADLLHAIRRQHVHPRPSAQVTVLGRLQWCTSVPAGCGTFLLYRSPGQPHCGHASGRLAILTYAIPLTSPRTSANPARAQGLREHLALPCRPLQLPRLHDGLNGPPVPHPALRQIADVPGCKTTPLPGALSLPMLPGSTLGLSSVAGPQADELIHHMRPSDRRHFSVVVGGRNLNHVRAHDVDPG